MWLANSVCVGRMVGDTKIYSQPLSIAAKCPDCWLAKPDLVRVGFVNRIRRHPRQIEGRIAIGLEPSCLVNFYF
jgi:hypothetical protein